MKHLSLFAIVALIFFGCSSPKQYYAFSTYKYQSKSQPDLKTLEPLGSDENTSHASAGDEIQNMPATELSQEEVGSIVINKLATANPVIESKIAEINKKYSDLTLSEEGDKSIKKEVRKDFKELRKEIKKEVKNNPEEYKAFLDDLLPQDGGGKSQLVALLLVLLVGGLSIHRFYLGYIWQGVVQLVLFIVGIIFWPVLIGWAVWWLIDLIRIITGDLKPSNGEYGTTF